MDTPRRSGGQGRPVTRGVIRLTLAVGIGILAAACGASGPTAGSARPTASSTGALPATTGTTGTTTTVAATATTAATGRTFIPAATPVQEFYSPSRNISCEIDYGTIGSGSPMQSVLCLTFSPPRSVVLSTDGSYRTCTGTDCLSNAGVGTPTLDYGDTTGVGPFRCLSATTGMTCTVTGGKGFRISTAGISPVSA